jgi:GDPmannose 4,6-dehydratase
VSSMRAVIVGHGGQDGRILWDQLCDRCYSIVGIGRSSLRTHKTVWTDQTTIDNVAGVRRLIEEFRPDQIYYLAAHHHSSQDTATGESDIWRASWQVHVRGFLHVLEAVRECRPTTRIFYASSSRVFGVAASSPQTEDTPLKPVCHYGFSKSTGMMLADYYRRTHGIHVSSGILYNHESPLRGRQFLSQRVAYGLAEIKAGLREQLEVGNLSAHTDWGYAPDYTLAMQSVLEHDFPDNFIIATGVTHSVFEMVETAAKYLGVDCKSAIVENATILQRNPLPLCGDATHLRQTTGWEPRVSFHDMVRILVEAAQAKILGQCFVSKH